MEYVEWAGEYQLYKADVKERPQLCSGDKNGKEKVYLLEG